MANVAGATFDLNGNSTTLKSLSGGGSTGGTVTMGSGNLTFSGGANATFAGSLTGTGNVTVGGGSSQAFTGTPGYTGATTVNSGTLSLSSSSSSTVGSATKDVTIAPAIHDVGTLNVGAGVSLTAGNLFVGSVDNLATTGGAGTLNQTGGSITATSVFLGGVGTVLNPARGVLNLSGGTLTAPGSHDRRWNRGGRLISMAVRCAATAGAILRALSIPTSPRLCKPAARTIDTNGNYVCCCRIILSMTQLARRWMEDLTKQAPGR